MNIDELEQRTKKLENIIFRILEWKINTFTLNWKLHNITEKIIKQLNRLYDIICLAIEWDKWSIEFLEHKKKKQLMPLYPQSFLDDKRNLYEVRWIDDKNINHFLKSFNRIYNWDYKLWRYIRSFESYLRDNCWFRDCSIKIIKRVKQN